MRVKRSRNVIYLIYKNNAEKNEMQITFKDGHTRGQFVTLAPSYQYGCKNSDIILLWTTSNNPHGVLIV